MKKLECLIDDQIINGKAMLNNMKQDKKIKKDKCKHRWHIVSKVMFHSGMIFEVTFICEKCGELKVVKPIYETK